MPDQHPSDSAATRRRRADAERSIASILEATVDCLSLDPDASMAEIARRAGVVRATIYVHFPTRESLIGAVTHHALAEATQAIESAHPESGDPVDALRRVISATWRILGRYHALVAINTQRPHEELHHQHESALGALEPLIVRGQSAGAFRADVPASWHLATLLALIHGASGELSAGRIDEDRVEEALVASVVGALTAPAPSRAPTTPSPSA
jgi:TetR/AcrR family transcriptional regulator, mexCD-oprJ operon repressor